MDGESFPRDMVRGWWWLEGRWERGFGEGRSERADMVLIGALFLRQCAEDPDRASVCRVRLTIVAQNLWSLPTPNPQLVGRDKVPVAHWCLLLP
jgi:hypothetical protein